MTVVDTLVAVDIEGELCGRLERNTVKMFNDCVSMLANAEECNSGRMECR